jgi:FKBP-type peptidyl-prolyl cis-trans isomerase
MKVRKTIFLLAGLAALTFAACGDTGSSTEWQTKNQEAYDSIKASPDWLELETIDGPTGVYYKDLTDPEAEVGVEYPIETSSVTINYTGWYYTGTVFDSGRKSVFNVNSLVRGFGAALQQMRVGQKWEVCIPYYLGYGISGTTVIQGYTTLFYEIELLQLTKHP